MSTLRDVVFCEPLRTPVGRFNGALADVSAARLAEIVISAIVERSGLDGALVDDVILGQAYPSSEAPPVARVAALDAGLPDTVGGLQLDRRCGSGLQALLDAAMQVQTGVSDLVIAGGVESMSNAPLYTVNGRRGFAGTGLMLHDSLVRGRVTAGGRDHPIPGGMIETAENLRREFALSREEQDQFALRSHERAVSAQLRGDFVDEIVPVVIPGRKGEHVVFDDEHPRADASLAQLARLRPILGSGDSNATVTAGNASGQNDGAAACIVTTLDLAQREGLTPIVALRSWARVGVAPERMGIGPVAATGRALQRAGLSLDDVDLIELNEAFAAQVLACLRALDIDTADERLNPNGSGISLGHPVGATGARIFATLASELTRRKGSYALETMCIGGGQGLAAVFERI